MNGFERRRESKKKSIFQAAFQLFTTNGIRNTTIAEIAEKAHVSQVSIYNFFGSKEELVREVIFGYMDEGLKASEKVLESKIPYHEKLEKLLFITDSAERQTGAEFFQSAIASDPLIGRLIGEYYLTRTEPFIIRLVDNGKVEGFINPDVSTEAIKLYIRALQGVLSQFNTSKKVILDLDTLFFYGLYGKPREFSGEKQELNPDK